jgi:hypothetical protein
VVVDVINDRSGHLIGRGYNVVGEVRLFHHITVEAPTVELSENGRGVFDMPPLDGQGHPR